MPEPEKSLVSLDTTPCYHRISRCEKSKKPDTRLQRPMALRHTRAGGHPFRKTTQP